MTTDTRELEVMHCLELVETITAYLEGTMDPDDRLRFDEHLAKCAKCQTYLDQMELTIITLGKLGEESIPPEGRGELLRVYREYRAG